MAAKSRLAEMVDADVSPSADNRARISNGMPPFRCAPRLDVCPPVFDMIMREQAGFATPCGRRIAAGIHKPSSFIPGVAIEKLFEAVSILEVT
jgi:hypothetical protein